MNSPSIQIDKKAEKRTICEDLHAEGEGKDSRREAERYLLLMTSLHIDAE